MALQVACCVTLSHVLGRHSQKTCDERNCSLAMVSSIAATDAPFLVSSLR